VFQNLASSTEAHIGVERFRSKQCQRDGPIGAIAVACEPQKYL